MLRGCLLSKIVLRGLTTTQYTISPCPKFVWQTLYLLKMAIYLVLLFIIGYMHDVLLLLLYIYTGVWITEFLTMSIKHYRPHVLKFLETLSMPGFFFLLSPASS